MVDVTVFSKPGCMPCKMTKKALDQGGVTYKEVDVSADPEAAAFIKSLGYSSLPVVTVDLEDGQDHWSGFHRMNLAATVEIAGRCA